LWNSEIPNPPSEDSSMRHTRLVLAGAVMVLLSSVSAIAWFQDVDCDLRFMGSARKAVKLRSAADGDSYTSLNGGRSVTVAQLLDFTCGLDSQVPSRIPSTRPMQDLETVKVNLKGFLLGVRFEKNHRQGDGKDNDFHVEIGGQSQWETPHVVVEVPPGQ